MDKLYPAPEMVAEMAHAGRKIAEERYDARLVARGIMHRSGLSRELGAG